MGPEKKSCTSEKKSPYPGSSEKKWILPPCDICYRIFLKGLYSINVSWLI
jgi:hypothetical protein